MLDHWEKKMKINYKLTLFQKHLNIWLKSAVSVDHPIDGYESIMTLRPS